MEEVERATDKLACNRTGYAHPGYVQSLREFGEPLYLPRSGGWLLKRAIPGADAYDAMAPYPYLVCADWSALATDLEALGDSLVSIAAVPDPFGNYSSDNLQRAFPHRVVHFKDHFVADLGFGMEGIIAPGNRTGIRRAGRNLTIELQLPPSQGIDYWNELFAHAVRRFDITGIRAFSPYSFAQQLMLPGASMYVIRRGSEAVGAAINLCHDNVTHAHVMAVTDEARKQGAAYLLYSTVIADLIQSGADGWIDWGGVAGTNGAASGLSDFKRGWSTGIRPAFFCGRILDQARYADLTAQTGQLQSNYFPAYRTGEKS